MRTDRCGDQQKNSDQQFVHTDITGNTEKENSISDSNKKFENDENNNNVSGDKNATASTEIDLVENNIQNKFNNSKNGLK